MTFEVAISRFRVPGGARPLTVNAYRGALGAYLHGDSTRYRAIFDPHWPDGPSGYRDAPRPFVLRFRGDVLELVTFRHATHREFVDALETTQLLELEHSEKLLLPLTASDRTGMIRVEFCSPTALKSEGRIARAPHFKILIQRLAERVRALGSLYQEWPGDADLSSLIARADRVTMRAFEWHEIAAEKRRSARSGQKHELRGYVGWAEYGGQIGELSPLLQVGEYAGVGRNTVWGNGQIRIIEAPETK